MPRTMRLDEMVGRRNFRGPDGRTMPRVAFEVPGVGYISSWDCRTGMRPGWDLEEDIRRMDPEHLDRLRELELDAFGAKIFVRLDE